MFLLRCLELDIKAKLTTALVKYLTPKVKPYDVVDSEIKGFSLRVQPSGVMSYYFSYRFNGKKERYLIGKHGTVTAPGAR